MTSLEDKGWEKPLEIEKVDLAMMVLALVDWGNREVYGYPWLILIFTTENYAYRYTYNHKCICCIKKYYYNNKNKN